MNTSRYLVILFILASSSSSFALSSAEEELQRLSDYVGSADSVRLQSQEDNPLFILREMEGEAIPVVARFLLDPAEPSELRHLLLNSFWVGNEEELISTVLSILEDTTQEPSLRSRCATALSLTGESEYVAIFIQMLQDQGPVVRQKSANALARYCDDSTHFDLIRPALITAMQDKDLLVRINATRAVGNFDHEDSKNALQEALAKQLQQGCSQYVSQDNLYCDNLTLQILEAMRKLPRHEYFPLIETILTSNDYSVSQMLSAVKAMGAIDTPEAWSLLQSLILDSKAHETVRLYSVTSLLQSSCPESRTIARKAYVEFSDPYSRKCIDSYIKDNPGR